MIGATAGIAGYDENGPSLNKVNSTRPKFGRLSIRLSRSWCGRNLQAVITTNWSEQVTIAPSTIQRIRAAAIATVTPTVWRLSPRRRVAVLMRFSQVEYDSGWQALRVASVQTDPAHRAELLLTALEEFHHSMLFRRLADASSIRPRLRPAERRSLWDEQPDLGLFLAAQYIGEASVHNEFSIYEAATHDPAIAGTFRDICLDEAKHVREAYQNLVANIGSEAEARRLIRKVQRGYDRRAVSKAAEPIGNTISGTLLMLLYYSMGLLLWPFARRRMRRA